MSQQVFAQLVMAIIAAGGDPGDAIKMIAHTFPGISFSPSNCTGEFQLRSNGDLVETTTGLSPTPAVGALEWHEDNTATIGADFTVEATLTSGTTPTTNAGLGVELNLGTNRTWGNTTTVEGLLTSTLTLEFRLASGGGVIKTITGVVVSADRSSL